MWTRYEVSKFESEFKRSKDRDLFIGWFPTTPPAGRTTCRVKERRDTGTGTKTVLWLGGRTQGLRFKKTLADDLPVE
jgi:hypothetical protein